MVDILREFWICETGNGQQVAKIHERYVMMMMMIRTGIGITWIKTVGEEGTNSTMGIRNFNL